MLARILPVSTPASCTTCRGDSNVERTEPCEKAGRERSSETWLVSSCSAKWGLQELPSHFSLFSVPLSNRTLAEELGHTENFNRKMEGEGVKIIRILTTKPEPYDCVRLTASEIVNMAQDDANILSDGDEDAEEDPDQASLLARTATMSSVWTTKTIKCECSGPTCQFLCSVKHIDQLRLSSLIFHSHSNLSEQRHDD